MSKDNRPKLGKWVWVVVFVLHVGLILWRCLTVPIFNDFPAPMYAKFSLRTRVLLFLAFALQVVGYAVLLGAVVAYIHNLIFGVWPCDLYHDYGCI